MLWHRGLDPLAVAGLASTRTYPLRSSFRPTYNMAVNLVPRSAASWPARSSRRRSPSSRPTGPSSAWPGRCAATRRRSRATPRRCTATSATSPSTPRCATDPPTSRRRAPRPRSASRRAEAAAEPRGAAHRRRHPHPGRAPRRLRRRRPARQARRQGRAGRPRRSLTEDKQVRRLTLVDVPEPVEALTHGQGAASTSTPAARSRGATWPRPLRIAVPHEPPPQPAGPARPPAASDGPIAELRRQMQAHPCHQCPEREDHARWAERWWRLKRETDGLQRKVEGRTNTVARTFDRICDAARRAGLPRATAPWSPTPGEHAAPALHREGPARRRVPAAGRVEAPRRRRAGRRRLGAGARAAPRRGRGLTRGCRTTTSPRRSCRDDPAVVRARGPRARPRAAARRASRTAAWPG